MFHILNSHSKVFVLDTTIKAIVKQQESNLNKRASWIGKVQEYDLDITPTKFVRGRGLCNAIAKGAPKQTKEEQKVFPLVLFVINIDDWFSNIAYFLTNGQCSTHLSPKENRTLKLKATKYIIWGDTLYKRGIDGTFLRFVDFEQRKELLQSFHNEACGGQFSASLTTYNPKESLLLAWDVLDAEEWVQKCESCQQFKGRVQLAAFPFKPIMIGEPFQQCCLDFIVPINPQSSARHSHILMATDYFTKWVEAIPVKKTTSKVVCNFHETKYLGQIWGP